MLLLLLIFAVSHSGLAALRTRGMSSVTFALSIANGHTQERCWLGSVLIALSLPL